MRLLQIGVIWSLKNMRLLKRDESCKRSETGTRRYQGDIAVSVFIYSRIIMQDTGPHNFISTYSAALFLWLRSFRLLPASDRCSGGEF